MFIQVSLDGRCCHLRGGGSPYSVQLEEGASKAQHLLVGEEVEVVLPTLGEAAEGVVVVACCIVCAAL